MSPFNIVASMWENFRLVFDVMFGSNPRAFWEQVRSDDPKLLAMSDITCELGWMDRVWPIQVHGDGAMYSKKSEDSVIGLQWKSMLVNDDWILPIFAFCAAARAMKGEYGDTFDVLCELAVYFSTCSGQADTLLGTRGAERGRLIAKILN